MRLLKAALTSIVFVAFIYGLFALGTWDYSTENWSVGVSIIYGFLSFFAMIAGAIFGYLEKEILLQILKQTKDDEWIPIPYQANALYAGEQH